MAKMLVRLAALEPGLNWIDPKYRWGKYDENVPGWILPSHWSDPDEKDPQTGEMKGGPRVEGWLSLTYTSSGPDCAPSYAVRRKLRDTKTLTGLQKLI